MKTEENITLVQRHWDAELRQDLDAVFETITDDCVYYDATMGKPIQGKEAITQYHQSVWKGFPDLSWDRDRENMVVTETHVVTWMVFEGTFRGPFRGLLPTGRTCQVPGVAIYRIRGDKICEEKIYYDALTLAHQMGLLPSPDKFFGRIMNLILSLPRYCAFQLQRIVQRRRPN